MSNLQEQSEKSGDELFAKNGILIVGAGLAGLSLALALVKRGITSTVIEKQSKILPSKWSILVYPQGIKIFGELGVLEDMKKLGIPLKPVEMVINGTTLLVADTGLLVEPRYNFHLNLGPSEIRQVLKKHAQSRGVEILEGVDATQLMRGSNEGKIMGMRAIGKKDQSLRISSKIVVDATGYKSSLRNQLGVQSQAQKHDSLVVSFFVNDYAHGQDRIQLFPGNGYCSVSLPCTEKTINLAYQERGLTPEKLKEKGGEAYVRRRILDAAPFLWQVFERCEATLSDGTMLTIQPTIAKTFPFVVDCAVVIGDSSHSVHPGTGSGAQLAFQDSMTLAPVIQKCLEEDDFSSLVLNGYELTRRPLMKTLDITSWFVDSMIFSKGRFKCWLRNSQLRALNKLISRKEYQEIIAGIRAPSRGEIFALTRTMILS